MAGNNFWSQTAYIIYTYDENGNRLTRENYNNMGDPEFSLGGTYRYSYNEDNKMTQWEMYLGGTSLVQSCNYTYNDEGQIILELGKEKIFSDDLEDSWKTEYFYDTNGNLTEKKTYYYNSGTWVYNSANRYEFDQNNNCIQWDMLTGTNVSARNKYTYDTDIAQNELIYPDHPESYVDDFVQMKNMLQLSEQYRTDNSGNLQFVKKFGYHYQSVTSGLHAAMQPNHLEIVIYPNPTSNKVEIATKDNSVIHQIELFDLSSKSVVNISAGLGTTSKSVDISALNSGIYLLKITTSNGVVIEKIAKN